MQLQGNKSNHQQPEPKQQPPSFKINLRNLITTPLQPEEQANDTGDKQYRASKIHSPKFLLDGKFQLVSLRFSERKQHH
jgi:hypothetical protein